MFQFMFNLPIADALKKRILKFIIKRLFGRFLLDELDLSQLDVQVYSGVISLQNLQLNVQVINEFLRDVPFFLYKGYIEKIEIKVPYRNLFTESLSIEVNGFELTFRLKDAPEKKKGKGSLNGEASEVLASSILLGDLSKSDLGAEILQDEEDSSVSNEPEGMEFIARCIEGIVSKIKASVDKATLRFQFPSTSLPGADNILLVHVPHLEFADETPMPSRDVPNRDWFPSLFRKILKFKGFFLQLFDEDCSDFENEFDQEDIESELNKGNIIVAGDIENVVTMQFFTGDAQNPRPFVSFDCSISAMHGVLTASRFKMLSEIMDTVTKAMAAFGSQKSEESSVSTPQPRSETRNTTTTNRASRDILENILEDEINSNNNNNNNNDTHNLSHIALGNNDTYSRSMESIDTDNQMEAAEHYMRNDDRHRGNYGDEMHFESDDFNAEMRSQSLHLKLRINSITCKLLYEEIDLTKMWTSYIDGEHRKHGPHVHVDHFLLSLTDVIFSSENNQDENSIDISIGTLGLQEKLRNTDDTTGSKRFITKNIVKFLPPDRSGMVSPTRKNSYSLSSSKNEHQLQFKVNFKKDGASSFDVSVNVNPMLIEFDLGIVERLNNVISAFQQHDQLDRVQHIHISPNSSPRGPLYGSVRKVSFENNSSMEKSVSYAIIKDITKIQERIDQPLSTSSYSVGFSYIKLNVLFPEPVESNNIDNEAHLPRTYSISNYRPDQLCLECENVELQCKQTQNEKDKFWNGSIGKLQLSIHNTIDNYGKVIFKVHPDLSSDEYSPVNIDLTIRDQSSIPVDLSGSVAMTNKNNIFLRFDQQQQDSDVDVSDDHDISDGLSDDSFSSANDDPLGDDSEGSDIHFLDDAKDNFEVDTTTTTDKIIQAAKIAVSISSSFASIDMEKSELFKLQRLFQDIASAFAQPEPAPAQQKSPENKHNTTAEWSKDSDQPNDIIAIEVSVAKAVALLHVPVTASTDPPTLVAPVSRRNHYQISLADFKLLQTTYLKPNPLLTVHASTESLAVEQVFSESPPRVLLRKYGRLVLDHRQIHKAMVLNLAFKSSFDSDLADAETGNNGKLVTIDTTIRLGGLILNHYAADEVWMAQLASFFDEGVEVPPVDYTTQIKVRVLFQDCAIDYAPTQLPSRAIMLMNSVKFSTKMITTPKPAPELHLKLKFEDISLLIHNHFGKIDLVRHFTEEVKADKSAFGFLADLKNSGFIQIGSLDSIGVAIRANRQDASKEKPPVFVECSKGILRLSSCADSFQTLLEVISSFSSSEPDANDIHQADTKATTSTSPLIAPVVISTSETGDVSSVTSTSINLLQNIKEDAFSASKNETVVVSTTESTVTMKPLSSRVLTQDDNYFGSILGRATVDDYFGNANKQGKNKHQDMDIEELSGHWANSGRYDDNNYGTDGESDEWIELDKKPNTINNIPEEGIIRRHEAIQNLELNQDYFPTTTATMETHNDTRVLPEKYPIPEFELVFTDCSVQWRLYGGYDYGVGPHPDELATSDIEEYLQTPITSSGAKKGSRDSDRVMELNLNGIYFQMDVFKNTSQYANRLLLSITDVELLDKLKVSNRNKFLSYLQNPEEPREPNSKMVHLVMEGVRPDIKLPQAVELRVALNCLPIRLNADQDAVKFLMEFFSKEQAPQQQASQPLPSEPNYGSVGYHDDSSEYDDSNSGISDSKNPFIQRNANSTQADDEHPSPPETTPAYFQLFEINDIILKIDYRPKEVDYSKLKNKDFLEILNFIPIEALEISLKATSVAGAAGFDNLLARLTEIWLPDILNTQLFHCLLGIMPIRSLVKMGSGVADLLIIPIEQYKRDGQILRGLRRGISSFLTNVALESVDLTANLSVGATSLLESLGELFSSSSSSSARASSGSGSSSEVSNKNNNNSGSSIANVLMPNNATEGLQQAYSSLSRGLKNAMYAVVAVPSGYNVGGTRGAAKEAIKALPVAVLSPMIGVTDALAKVLYGIRNSYNPAKKQEHDQIYKK